MQKLMGFIVGLLFGVGLIISEMVNPLKVQNFLDILGQWDPSLIWVMTGAITVSALGFWLARGRQVSLLGQSFSQPKRSIDRRLVVGALMFGSGWGVAGMCPAPALLVASLGIWQGVVFCMAMLAGMGLFQLYDRITADRVSSV